MSKHKSKSQIRQSASTNLIPFTFDNHSIRTLRVNGQPWFVASDLCEALGISNVEPVGWGDEGTPTVTPTLEMLGFVPQPNLRAAGNKHSSDFARRESEYN
jgi:prophage antirepressor-like protein